MDMQPNDTSIKLLFNSGSQFSIPRFQREYSWDKKNYQEFIDDMLNCLTLENNELKNTSYFLGTMLFIGDFVDKNRVDKYIHVVDGQQRLTTFLIFLKVLCLKIGAPRSSHLILAMAAKMTGPQTTNPADDAAISNARLKNRRLIGGCTNISCCITLGSVPLFQL